MMKVDEMSSVVRTGQADLEEKSICANGKEARPDLSFVLASKSEPPFRAGAIRVYFERGLEVDMRACPNTKCVTFGRIVYSVATRCPLCKWDLKSVLPASETAPAKPDRHLPASR